jgi:glycosyltransferase involved in cell wall biosynthesis
MVNLERLLNYATTRIVFVSPSEVAACAEAGAFDQQKSVIIQNCVAIPATVSRLQRKTNKDLRFIAVTRLDAEKGNSGLIDIMSELSNHTRQFRLTIVGDGPERGEVQKKISAYGLESLVVLLGARDDVPELLLEADAYITSSYGEAHSIAMLEAMSYALPVIASRVRGHVDMISDGVNGILFDLNDPKKAASNILQLINNDKLALRMGSNGRNLVINNYSLEVMLSRVRMLYKDVIANNV